jgi:hypothetical protein
MMQEVCKAITPNRLIWLSSLFPGLLLLAAGLAKVDAWIVDGQATMFLNLPNSLAFSLVAAEVLSGVGMLVYRRSVLMLYGAIALFAFFTGVAIANLFGNELSCGCFGRVGFSASVMLLLNVLALLILVSRVFSESHHLLSVFVFQFGIIPVFGISGFVGVGYFSDFELGSGFDSGGLAIVDRGGIKRIYARPQLWSGAELPILQFVENRSELVAREYRLIIYRSDCHKCTAKIGKLSATTSMRYLLDISEDSKKADVFDLASESLFAKVNLASGFELIVDVPVAIDVKDGRVVAIVDEAN